MKKTYPAVTMETSKNAMSKAMVLFAMLSIAGFSKNVRLRFKSAKSAAITYDAIQRTCLLR